MVTRTCLQTSFQPAIFLLLYLCTLFSVQSQVMTGHVDDFQSLTVSGWVEGGVSPNPPVVIPTGGPDDKGDAFLQNVSSGTAGAGGKWLMFNQSSNWTGDYLSAGVSRIGMQVRNSGNQIVNMRIAFNGPGGAISSQSVFTIVPGSGWQSIEFVIEPQAFVALMAGGNPDATLSAVNDFRILSNPMALNIGEEIMATVDIDNIYAEGISAVGTLNTSEWQAFPNPATDIVQLTSQDDHATASVVLINTSGTVVKEQTLLPPYQLDVSCLHTGMYFLIVNQVNIIPVKIGL